MGKPLSGAVAHKTALEDVELIARNNCWQWAPAVAVADQRNEIGPWGDAAATLYFFQAQGDRLVIESCFFADTPSQVDSLEMTSVPLA